MWSLSLQLTATCLRRGPCLTPISACQANILLVFVSPAFVGLSRHQHQSETADEFVRHRAQSVRLLSLFGDEQRRSLTLLQRQVQCNRIGTCRSSCARARHKMFAFAASCSRKTDRLRCTNRASSRSSTTTTAATTTTTTAMTPNSRHMLNEVLAASYKLFLLAGL